MGITGITAIQQLKLNAVLSDLSFLSDGKLSIDEKLDKIDELDQKIAKFIPDEATRSQAMTKMFDLGEKMMKIVDEKKEEK